MKEPLKAYLRASHVEEPKECWTGVEVDELGSIMYEPRDALLGSWIDHNDLYSYITTLWVFENMPLDGIATPKYNGQPVFLLDNTIITIMKRSVRDDLMVDGESTSTEENKWRTIRIMADALMYRSTNPGVDIYYVSS